MVSRTKKLLLAAGFLLFAAALLSLGRPCYLLASAWLDDRHDRQPTAPGHVDDASRMNATSVAQVVSLSADRAEAQAQMQALLERARSQKLHVSISGARHSMGGQTIAPGGIVVDMTALDQLELDEEKRLLTAGGGARWSKILPFLDARGLSVLVMQSNNDFTVGGSLSANCHGWPCNRPPIASTVESLRLMLASGEIVRCSRTENAELFSLALGGYGLFGIVLDATLQVVPNERYQRVAEVVPAREVAALFRERVTAEVDMAYGRLCVVPGEDFLAEAILTVMLDVPGELAALGEDFTGNSLRRQVFRAQRGSVAGKELRWMAETTLRTGDGEFFTRNELLHDAAAVYAEANDDRSDILHEYFIPIERTEEFLAQARNIVPKYSVDLLNVTLRDLKEDKDTFLRYADRDMFGLVMLFDHPRDVEADKEMERFTQAMIDAALECGGRYYLPYRLHARPDQFRRAYPQADEFFAKKRHYDPDGIFVNQFFLKYGG